MEFKQFLNEINIQIYHIYLDMDGVLTNFEKQFLKLGHGDSLKWHETKNKNEKKMFYKFIRDAGKEFWSTMEWMPDGKQLWTYLKKYNPTILSTPTEDEFSRPGKKEWLKNNLKLEQENRIILSDNKYKFVKHKTDILIDDRTDNIEKWRNAGGIGIIHKNTKDTISQLNKIL